MSKAKNLVIVESPAKAKTIEQYLGGDYLVRSSFGHVRDLPKKDIGLDEAHGFEPHYEVSPDKQKVIAELKKLAKDHTVWLASDEDREGEAIAWHLTQALKLDSKKTNRIVFHEITKPAILHAIEHPRTINQELVDAQQARRVLDRLVGYKLSPVLWKKVQAGLSAGRVQSVAVRLIVEREREIKAFDSESTYKVIGTFTSDKHAFDAELEKRLKDDVSVKEFLEACKSASFKISTIDKKPASRNPSAPFTTSTLQQEASRRLGYSVRQTMTLAQRLYENGHITYMRTDSTVLSNLALAAAESHIVGHFGKEYAKRRQYATKNTNAQEAHEAIRPTNFAKTTAGDDPQQKKLYELIWKRTLASQMSAATMERTELRISVSTRSEQFVAKGEILQFEGFMKVYGGGKDDVILPPLDDGQELDASQINARQTFSKPPARYSEASLVRKMEELGIGRPSTYAPTIGVIQARGYVEKSELEPQKRDVKSITLAKGAITEATESENYGADKAKLVPTYLADLVTDFLTKHFTSIVDYDFTAKAEAELDDIADGKLSWKQMIADFYKNFAPLVTESESITRAEATHSRELGVHPKSGEPIIARYGRYGPMLQLGDGKDKLKKPQFAPMPQGKTIEDVTFEQALEMFNLPRVVGTTEDGQQITANLGRFGPYVQYDRVFVSIKPLDPFTITEAEARKKITEKAETEAKKVINDFGDIKVLNGRFGPYVTDGTTNAKIPKDVKPESLDEKAAKKLLKEAPAKKGGFKRRKTTTKKKK